MFVEMQLGQMFFKRLWSSFYLQFWTNLVGRICRATKAKQTVLAKTDTPLETDVKKNVPPLSEHLGSRSEKNDYRNIYIFCLKKY